VLDRVDASTGLIERANLNEERLELPSECDAVLDRVDAPSGLIEREVVAVPSFDKSCGRLILLKVDDLLVDLLRGVSTVANKSWWS